MTQPGGEFLLYEAEDGRTRVECRFVDETLWLTQALMALGWWVGDDFNALWQRTGLEVEE